MSNPVAQVIREIPGRFGSLAFQGFRAGEIGFEDWITYEAIASAETAGDWHPRPYSLLPDALRNYCLGRVDRTTPYDGALALKLGFWFHRNFTALQFNNERLEHFIWVLERMRDKKLEALEAKSLAIVTRFQLAMPPLEDTELCLKTKERDAWDREKAKKRD
jgi:hypothetical protein